MAECSVCEKTMGWADRTNAKEFDGMCRQCTDDLRRKAAGKDATEKAIKEAKEEAEAIERKAEVETIIITTETAPNLNITERLDIVTAQAAFEINQFKDAVVGLLNPVKGRSSELEKQLDVLKERSLYGLKEKAFDLGANGIVAVDLDISTVTIGQISMLMMVASGTAVIVEWK